VGLGEWALPQRFTAFRFVSNLSIHSNAPLHPRITHAERSLAAELPSQTHPASPRRGGKRHARPRVIQARGAADSIQLLDTTTSKNAGTPVKGVLQPQPGQRKRRRLSKAARAAISAAQKTMGEGKTRGPSDNDFTRIAVLGVLREGRRLRRTDFDVLSYRHVIRMATAPYADSPNLRAQTGCFHMKADTTIENLNGQEYRYNRTSFPPLPQGLSSCEKENGRTISVIINRA
jgi:hypothetical protein